VPKRVLHRTGRAFDVSRALLSRSCESWTVSLLFGGGAGLGKLQGIIAAAALLCGFGLPLISWLFFRQPGVSVCTPYAPIWRGGEYLTGMGVVLWLAGLPAITLGALLILIATRSGTVSADPLADDEDPPVDS
jgi:hypothetical protein